MRENEDGWKRGSHPLANEFIMKYKNSLSFFQGFHPEKM
jgi:hypothetical protein